MRGCILLLLIISCTSFSSPSSLTSFRGTAMTIDFQILVKNGNAAPIDQIVQAVFAEVNEIYNKWNPASELSLFNSHRSLEPIPLSSKLHRLLSLTGKIVALSEGRFDPTIEPVQQVWKKALEQGLEPEQASIDLLSPAIGWDKIHFDSRFIRKDHPGTELDLGGIAKGYAVDLLYAALKNAGFDTLYVEWGGEIRASKFHPAGRPWKVGITHSLAEILLSDQSVATSGDYEQFWKVAGSDGIQKTYIHVINPFTLKQIEIKPKGIKSSTTLADSCVLADGIAKVGLFFDTLEEAEAWALNLKSEGVTFIFQERT